MSYPNIWSPSPNKLALIYFPEAFSPSLHKAELIWTYLIKTWLSLYSVLLPLGNSVYFSVKYENTIMLSVCANSEQTRITHSTVIALIQASVSLLDWYCCLYNTHQLLCYTYSHNMSAWHFSMCTKLPRCILTAVQYKHNIGYYTTRQNIFHSVTLTRAMRCKAIFYTRLWRKTKLNWVKR